MYNTNMLRMLLSSLLAPKSKDKDLARREFILNILLFGALFSSFILTSVAWGTKIYKAHIGAVYDGVDAKIVFIVFIIFILGYIFSRKGKYIFVAHALIWICFTITIYTSIRWGAETPEALLGFVLIIVMAGILIHSRFAFLLTGIISFILLLLTQLQFVGFLSFDKTWRNSLPDLGDAITYVSTLGIIALVSWLFNRESEKTLKRVQRSEAALRRQRNHLEVVVEKRARELRQTQAEKIAQLYRFAEFGRSASGLMHDLSNPLTLISLSLHRLRKNDGKEGSIHMSEAKTLLSRALSGTKRLELFLQAARRQIQNQKCRQPFLLNHEIRTALRMLDYRARKAQIRLTLRIVRDTKIVGNPIKFNQLVTNLVSNAIDAYVGLRRNDKRIEVRLDREKKGICRLDVQDWGSGIRKNVLPRIYEPLFTTKPLNKGVGIGLSLCKDTVEKEMGGTISVITKIGKGSTFTVLFPVKKARRLPV